MLRQWTDPLPAGADTLRGHRVVRLVGKGNKPATMPITVPVLRVLEACRGERTTGPADPAAADRYPDRPVRRVPDGHRDRKATGIPRHISPHSLRHAAITNALDAGLPLRDAQILARHPRPQDHRALRPRPRQPRPTRGAWAALRRGDPEKPRIVKRQLRGHTAAAHVSSTGHNPGGLRGRLKVVRVSPARRVRSRRSAPGRPRW